MKKIIILLILSAAIGFAQRQTILEGNIESGVEGAVSVKFTNIKNNFGVLVGGHAGWLINHQFLIGASGYGLVNNIRADKSVDGYYSYIWQPLITLGYGGGFIEYYFSPDRLVHSSVSLLIGAGGVNYRSSNTKDYYNNDSWGWDWSSGKYTSTSTFFVLEPGLSAELNVTSYFKFGVNASYRYISGSDIVGLKDADLSNFSAGVSFKIGLF